MATPLLELRRFAASHGATARIIGKLEAANPMGSVKDRIRTLRNHITRLCLCHFSNFFGYYMVGSWLLFLPSHFLTMVSMFSIGIKLLQATSLSLPLDSVLTPIIVMAMLAVICVTISIRFFRWE